MPSEARGNTRETDCREPLRCRWQMQQRRSVCSGLTSVTSPDSVTTIGEYAFNGCTNLTIYGKAGSEAEKYAKEREIPFVVQQLNWHSFHAGILQVSA